MVNPNKKVKRPDGLGKVYKYQTDENEKIYTLPIRELIEENYVYIDRAMDKENFYIKDNESCYFFKEILYDNEVVGFATYRGTNISEKSLIMQYIYILPEYRRKGLLQEELDEATLLFESGIIIEYPNRDIIDSLIKHRLARIFEDRYLISKVPFIVPMVPYDAIKEGVLREDYDDTDNEGFSKLSLVYDLDLCAVVCLSQNEKDRLYEGNASEDELNDFNILSLPLKADDEKYNCVEKRINDSALKDGTYFDKVKEIMDANDEIIENWLSML